MVSTICKGRGKVVDGSWAQRYWKKKIEAVNMRTMAHDAVSCCGAGGAKNGVSRRGVTTSVSVRVAARAKGFKTLLRLTHTNSQN